MNQKKLTNFEFGTLNYFMTRALLIGATFNFIVNKNKQDCWIIPLLSIIPAVFFILLINYIFNYKPKLSIPNKIISLFGGLFGKIFIFIILFFAFIMCTFNYLNLCNFIQSQFLTLTPIYVIAIIFAIAIIYVLSKGIFVIGRTSVILFYIGFGLFLLSLLGLIPNLNISNLKPFFISNTSNYLDSVNAYFALNIVPIFSLLIIPKDVIKNAKIKKTLFISYITSCLSVFVIVFTTITTFGYELTKLFEFPEFHVLKYISLIGLTSRIESILVMQLLFDIFVSLVVIIYFISENAKNLIPCKKTNLIYFIVCFFAIIGTLILARFNTILDELMKNFIPTFSSIFSIIMLLIICTKIKTSNKLKKP